MAILILLPSSNVTCIDSNFFKSLTVIHFVHLVYFDHPDGNEILYFHIIVMINISLMTNDAEYIFMPV